VQLGVDIILALLQGIRDNIDNIVTVALEIVSNLVDSLLTAIPMLVSAGIQIILALIQGIADNIQLIIDAGVNLLIQFLFGITRDVILIVQAVGTIITALITAITGEAVRIAQAGTDSLITFLGALTGDIIRIAAAITSMITTLITEIENNAELILDAGTAALIHFLDALSEDIAEITPHVQTLIDNIFSALIALTATFTKAGADFIVKFFQEMVKATREIAEGAKNMLVAILSTAATKIVELTNELAGVAIAFLNGMADAIEKNSSGIASGVRRIAMAIVHGISKVFGLGSVKDILMAAAEDLLGPLWWVIEKVAGIKSPSKKMMEYGWFMVEGLAIGLSDTKPASDASTELAHTTMDSFQNTMNALAAQMSDMDEFNPTITPVLDLTQVMRDAKDLNALALTTPMAADVSLKHARYISHTNDPGAVETITDQTAPTVVNFEQNNYSPTALSTNDIYRLTRSQIALAKEELKIP
jgi:hypothetical protein